MPIKRKQAWKGFIPRLEWKSPSSKQILSPKKFLGQRKYYGSKEILGPPKILILKNFWVQNNCESKKILAQKKFRVRKYFGKIFWTAKYRRSEIFLAQTNFWVTKSRVQ